MNPCSGAHEGSSGLEDVGGLRIAVHVDGAEADVVARCQEERAEVPLPDAQVESILDTGHADIIGGGERYGDAALGRDLDGRRDRRGLVREVERGGPSYLGEGLLPLELRVGEV